MNKWLYLTGMMLFLGACRAPDIAPFSVTDFAEADPITPAVSRITVRDRTVRYPNLPHLETRIPVVPAYALKQALDNRFKPRDPQAAAQMNITIEEASLTQRDDPSETWYVYDNVSYRLDYRVRIAYAQDAAIKEQQIVTGWEVQSLPRKSSLADKEQAWQKMINAMIAKVSDKIQNDIPPPLR